jgi:hypothetical protein
LIQPRLRGEHGAVYDGADPGGLGLSGHMD